MFVSLRRVQTWRLHTKLYKFGWYTSANSARMKNCRDLILGEFVYITESSIVSQILEFIYWMVTIFILIIWLMKTENSLPYSLSSLWKSDRESRQTHNFDQATSTREPSTRAWISAEIWRQNGAICSNNRKIVPYHRCERILRLKAMLHEAIFLATCNATTQQTRKKTMKEVGNTPFCNCNCCVASCKKSKTTLYFAQRCGTSYMRVTSPQQLATQLFSEWANQLAGDFRHLVCYCTRCKLRKKLQTCDTPSATWNFFYFSSLRCKLQEKLLRVTWPIRSPSPIMAPVGN